jgi:hypothetical protein
MNLAQAMELSEESAHSNEIPVSNSYVSMSDDGEENRPHDLRIKEGETKAERRTRLAGIYARGMAD